MFAYIGSRTTRERNARGEGISVYRIHEHTGDMQLVEIVGGLTNPSFLARNQSGNRLYVVHGDGETITSFSVDHLSGKLSILNQQNTGGMNPVHLAIDPSGRFIVVSNHISGSLSVLPIDDDGSILPLIQTVQLTGEPGPHRKEQPFSKPHFNPFDPTGQYVLVPDKGLDKVFVFRFSHGKLTPAENPVVFTRETSGPRHLAFHPTKLWAYVVNELDSSVTSYHFDSTGGKLEPFQIVPSLDDTYTGNSRSSEIEVNQSGTFLYASNRGEDSIVVFSIDSQSGRLSRIQTQSSQGKTPRFFALSPCNSWLYALNEDSDSIVMFEVSPTDGTLSPRNKSFVCGSPVCMIFI